MSGPRLKQQFQTLFQHYDGADSEVTVGELMDILRCTRRNVRMVMGKLSDEGWVSWAPAVGRGKLSKLQFRMTNEALIQADVAVCIQEGKFDKALQLLGNDQQKLASFIGEQLGYATVQGRQVLRLPYYRAINPLDPLRPMRRSEHHLARQVFNGLTRFCEKTATIKADLAHHWKRLSATQWRFFVRPSVRFHSGTMVGVEDYITSLTRLSSLPLFRHIDYVDSPFANVIDVHLSSEDYHLPEQLASIEAVILPAVIQEGDGVNTPIGTGPYRVLVADEQRMKLEAFDHYFGFRALIDEIEIWVLDSISACELKPNLGSSESLGYGQVESTKQTRLDEGCSYLVLNQRHGLCVDPFWQQYVINRFNAIDIHQRLKQEESNFLEMIPAYGFLPGWMHSAPKSTVNHPPGHEGRLSIAYIESHPIFAKMAEVMKSMLVEDGICCHLVAMNYVDFHERDKTDIDIWLGSINLVSRHPSMIINWMFQYQHLSRSMPIELLDSAFHAISKWRSSEQCHCPAEAILNDLVTHRNVIPLFHTWAGVKSGEQVKGAETNSMGWFDFTSVWVDPAI